MSHAIFCRQLFKTYANGKKRVEALRGIDLKISAGQCFGLLGPNGAGKTTTVEILEGLLEPTSGEVEVLGEKWGAGRDAQLRQSIGLTLQESRFQDKLSVLEILRLFRSFYQRGRPPEEALALVSLEEKANAWVRELSGGQRQRLALASALVGDPELLFLDEPTTGLDPQARRQVWDVVTRLKKQGTTILLTTHYMDEAEKLCETVAVIDHGKVIAEDSPRQLIAQLGGEHVIEFSLQEGLVPLQSLNQLDTVSKALEESDGYLLTVGQPHLAIPALLEFLAADGKRLQSLTTRHVNLEDVFVSLTGRHLRDV